MFFTHSVDRAQLGDAHRGKAEAEMIRIVHGVQKGAGKSDRGLVLKNGANTHIWVNCAHIRWELHDHGGSCIDNADVTRHSKSHYFTP